MERVKKIAPFVVVLALSCMLWSFALRYADYAHSYFNTVSLRFENKHLKLTSVRDIINKEIESNSEENISVTAWSVERWVMVEDRFLNKSASADAIYIYGSVPNSLSIYSDGDCVVSEDVAYELWKDTESGRKLMIGGKERTVRQVVGSLENTVLLLAGDDGPDASGLELNFPQGGSSSGIESFLSNHGLNPSATVRYEDVCSVLAIVVRLPGFVVIVAVAGAALLSVRRIRGSAHKVAAWGTLVFIFILCLAMNGTGPQITQDLIPTRWSDFEFWQQKLSLVQDGIHRYVLTPHTRADLLFEQLLFRTVASSFLASVFTIWALRLLKTVREADAVWAASFALAVPFAVFLKVGGWSLWYQALISVYILTEYIFGAVSGREKSFVTPEEGNVHHKAALHTEGDNEGLAADS